jgi:hypothetical protein
MDPPSGVAREGAGGPLSAQLRWRVSASVGRGLHEQCDAVGAELLAVGSSRRGPLGRVVVADDTGRRVAFGRADAPSASLADAVAGLVRDPRVLPAGRNRRAPLHPRRGRIDVESRRACQRGARSGDLRAGLRELPAGEPVLVGRPSGPLTQPPSFAPPDTRAAGRRGQGTLRDPGARQRRGAVALSVCRVSPRRPSAAAEAGSPHGTRQPR